MYVCFVLSVLAFTLLVFLFLQMANNPGTQQMYKKNLYMMDSMTDDELDGKVNHGIFILGI